MDVSWKSEEGHLVCQWSEHGERAPYHPPWMQETCPWRIDKNHAAVGSQNSAY